MPLSPFLTKMPVQIPHTAPKLSWKALMLLWGGGLPPPTSGTGCVVAAVVTKGASHLISSPHFEKEKSVRPRPRGRRIGDTARLAAGAGWLSVSTLEWAWGCWNRG